MAFGAMPPQILTPTQLQVITGIMPSQMVPISHAGTSIVGQSGEISASNTLPPGHVTNLMLPGQLSAQPIPMHAVTLMSVTGGTSQVFYSMPGHSPVVPVTVSNVVTTSSTQIPVTNQLPVPAAIGPLTSSPAVHVASQNTVTESQSPLLMPQISSVHSAGSQGQLTASGNTSLPNQIYSQMILPVAAPLGGQAQSHPTSNVRPSLTTKTEISRMLPVPGVQLPSISHLGTPSRVQTPAPAVACNKGPVPAQDRANEEADQLESLNSGDTLVVEMKPVIQDEKASESFPGSKPGLNGEKPTVQAVAMTLVPENDDKIIGSSFKEPTLTLSEEGVVALGDVESSASEVSRSIVQTVTNIQMVAENRE